MTDWENMYRIIRFERPDYIKMTFHLSDSVWYHYDREAVFELLESHPLLFPSFDRSEKEKALAEKPAEIKSYRDRFGVLWDEAIPGIRGAVTEHPIKSLEDISEYKMPDVPVTDIEKERERVARQKQNGEFTYGSFGHGHTFLRATDLCGYENVLFAMYDEDENINKLLSMIAEYNSGITTQLAQCGYDMIDFGEDLGMQVGPMLSPDLFRKYIKPAYSRIMKPAIDSGAVIHMHSDGDVRTLIDDMLDAGVEVVNIQDLVNGIDWIRDRFYGKRCVELDIDRQKITPFGTPRQIEELIRDEVKTLSSPAGGLYMIYGWYAGVPLENARALMDAMEKYMFYWD